MRETTFHVVTRLVLRALRDEKGQDLVEYALVFVTVALGATEGMNSVASNINAFFANRGNILTNATT